MKGSRRHQTTANPRHGCNHKLAVATPPRYGVQPSLGFHTVDPRKVRNTVCECSGTGMGLLLCHKWIRSIQSRPENQAKNGPTILAGKARCKTAPYVLGFNINSNLLFVRKVCNPVISSSILTHIYYFLSIKLTTPT